MKNLFQSHANMLWDAMLPLSGRPFPSPHPHICLENCSSCLKTQLRHLIFYHIFPDLPHSPKQTGSHPSSHNPVQMAIGAPSTVYCNQFCAGLSPTRWWATEFLLLHQSSSIWHMGVAQHMFAGQKKKKMNRQTNWLELVSVPPPSHPEIVPNTTTIFFIMEILDGNP